jgi:acetolactate synthase-1/2/3 large subunit
MLSQAHHPVVIAGAGARWSHAGEALRQFIETTHLPLFAKPSDVNVIPAPHPLFFGKATPRCGAGALRGADVVLALGCQFDALLHFGKPPLFAEDAQFIVVDTDATTIGFNRPFAVGIIGDVRSVVEEMTTAAARYDFVPRRDWLSQLEQARLVFNAKVAEAAHSNATPIHPLRLCQAVREFYGDDATIALDGGDISGFAHIAFNHYQPPHFLFTGPIGGIGQGVAFVLAGKLARPDQPAVLLSGDGSMGYGIIEYDTAFKHQLPFVAVVSSDGAWGIVRHPQIKRYGIERAVATDLRDVPYHKIVEAMGGHGEYVENPHDLRPALERAQSAVDQGVPALVNVKTQFVSSSDFVGQG